MFLYAHMQRVASWMQNSTVLVSFGAHTAHCPPRSQHKSTLPNALQQPAANCLEILEILDPKCFSPYFLDLLRVNVPTTSPQAPTGTPFAQQPRLAMRDEAMEQCLSKSPKIHHLPTLPDPGGQLNGLSGTPGSKMPKMPVDANGSMAYPLVMSK